MLNNNKIRIMSKLAMFEQNEGKEDLRLSKYYRLDYLRLHLLTDIVSVTIGYLLILGVVLFYNLEYIIANAITLNYLDIGYKVLGIYIFILIFYGAYSLIMYSIKYNRSKKKLHKYFKDLKALREVYREEESEIK